MNGNNRSIGQRNARARERALEAAARLEAAPTGLVRFESAGRLLVIGDGEALARLPLIGDGLQTRLLSTGGEKDAGADAVRQRGRNLRLEGHLGRFHVYLANEDGSVVYRWGNIEGTPGGLSVVKYDIKSLSIDRLDLK